MTEHFIAGALDRALHRWSTEQRNTQLEHLTLHYISGALYNYLLCSSTLQWIILQ